MIPYRWFDLAAIAVAILLLVPLVMVAGEAVIRAFRGAMP